MTIAPKTLSQYFQDRTLANLDLYGIDFSNLSLENVSFSGSFIVGTNFNNAFLQGADFSYCKLRNVDFTDSILTNADFTGADWFNASGFTKKQLKSVQQETLLPYPEDRKALYNYLDENYMFPFHSWKGYIRKQLLDTWDKYSQEIEDYQRSNKPQTLVSEALIMPLIDDLDLSRDRDTGREIDFD